MGFTFHFSHICKYADLDYFGQQGFSRGCFKSIYGSSNTLSTTMTHMASLVSAWTGSSVLSYQLFHEGCLESPVLWITWRVNLIYVITEKK